MMLCKLSLKNIQKSLKSYAIYFFTLILGVAIFYVFNAIESQTVMLKVSSSTNQMIDLMTDMLSGVSVFVSFILGFLIIYASRFLMKRRKKEFGIYLTLGMGKRKISMILFLETLFIGMISLAVGLVVGVLLSQLMSLFVANMFEADLTHFSFTFSSNAFFKTFLYFGMMYLFVMIFNTVMISKCKLIDLLHSSRKSERIKLKNPIVSTIVFLVSSCTLGYAYYLVTGGIDQLNDTYSIFLPILLGAVSTFFLFWSLSGLLLRIFMCWKKFYYKGLNSFTLRQFSSKINTTVFSMTLICLMLFVTICVFSSSLSIKNSMTANLKKLAPVDIEFYKALDLDEEKIGTSWRYNENMIEDSKLSIQETLSKMDIDVDSNFTDLVDVKIYATNAILLQDTLGTYSREAKAKYPYLRYDSQEEFISLSDYNRVAQLFGMPTFTLQKNEYILVADYDGWIPIRNEALKRNTSISLLGKTYVPKYSKVQDGFLHISNNPINMGFFIVPDEALEASSPAMEVVLANYKETTKEGKQQMEELILQIEDHSYLPYTNLMFSTKIALYESSVGLGAMVTFLGLYLGIIFLISSAAILALKELSESSDNKERFRMLRKIGTDEKMLNQALFRQIAIFFLFPLLIAIIHSIFGIWFCNYLLVTFGNQKLLLSILMTSLFLLLIYGGYFLITYLCSKNIIREHS